MSFDPQRPKKANKQARKALEEAEALQALQGSPDQVKTVLIESKAIDKEAFARLNASIEENKSKVAGKFTVLRRENMGKQAAKAKLAYCVIPRLQDFKTLAGAEKYIRDTNDTKYSYEIRDSATKKDKIYAKWAYNLRQKWHTTFWSENGTLRISVDPASIPKPSQPSRPGTKQEPISFFKQ